MLQALQAEARAAQETAAHAVARCTALEEDNVKLKRGVRAAVTKLQDTERRCEVLASENAALRQYLEQLLAEKLAAAAHADSMDPYHRPPPGSGGDGTPRWGMAR